MCQLPVEQEIRLLISLSPYTYVVLLLVRRDLEEWLVRIIVSILGVWPDFKSCAQRRHYRSTKYRFRSTSPPCRENHTFFLQFDGLPAFHFGFETLRAIATVGVHGIGKVGCEECSCSSAVRGIIGRSERPYVCVIADDFPTDTLRNGGLVRSCNKLSVAHPLLPDRRISAMALRR